MEEDSENNKVLEHSDEEHYEFKFNFINTPWDDRSSLSKIGIVSLLSIILLAIAACVINNFIMQFKKTPALTEDDNLKCHVLKLEEYPFLARVHSTETQELLCVGAVVGVRTVLASGVCVKSGPVHLRLGSLSLRGCRKVFAVEDIKSIQHEAVDSTHLALLSAYEKFGNCAQVISIGINLLKEVPVKIFGRPLNKGLFLLSHYAKLAEIERNENEVPTSFKTRIYVESSTSCPVRAGDLLIQKNKLFGLASTSKNINEQNNVVCFADLRAISHQLNEFLGIL